MKKNMNEKRIYMTTNFLGTKMVLPQITEYRTETKKIGLSQVKEELNNHKNIFSSIKNGALNNTLKKMGLKWEQYIDEFKAEPGDLVIEIQVVGIPKLYEYSSLPELPKYCNLVFRKIMIY
jgi:hypothetical protein